MTSTAALHRVLSFTLSSPAHRLPDGPNPDHGPLETSDSDIIARVLHGQPERFHELVQRHAGPLWGTIRAAVRNREDARDVLQETWLRAFERLAALREPGRLRPWLVSIALNLVRQRHRRGDVVEQGSSLDLLRDDTAEDAGVVLERREEAVELRLRIAALPPRQREVLDLRLTHELSHGEIADLLGITPESSRASYYQALRKLRDADETPNLDTR